MTQLFLTLSVILNIVLIWYIIQLLKRFLTFQEELDSLRKAYELDNPLEVEQTRVYDMGGEETTRIKNPDFS